MSRCGIDFRRGKVFLTIPRWRTDDVQMMVFFGPVVDPIPEVVGSRVRAAIETVRRESDKVWEKDDLTAQGAVLHEIAGTKGWEDFSRDAAHVSAEEDAGVVTVVPHRYVGAGRFEGMNEPEWLRGAYSSDAQLGELVLAALNRSGADITPSGA